MRIYQLSRNSGDLPGSEMCGQLFSDAVRNTFTWQTELACQVNELTLCSPLLISRSRVCISIYSIRMASNMSFSLRGSMTSAASPATSGQELTFEVMTGQPQDMASSIGRPKPSYKDGKTKPSARW